MWDLQAGNAEVRAVSDDDIRLWQAFFYAIIFGPGLLFSIWLWRERFKGR